MKKKKKKRGAYGAGLSRRSMDVSLALVRCALACSVFILATGALSVSGIYAKLPAYATLIVELLLTLGCFGLTAKRGLLHADGDQSDKLCRRALGPGQLMYLFAAGVLLVCPMTLLTDLLCAPFARMEITRSAAAAPDFRLFLPVLFKSAVLAPVCEELFFRGYLFAVLKEAGNRWAVLLTSLFFALVHGVDAALLPRFLMGLLLCALMLRTDSLLAPMVVHAAYNLSIIMLSYAGMGGLFSGLGFVSCALRLAGCAAFAFALREAYHAREVRGMFEWNQALTLRQSLLHSFSLGALIFVPMVLYYL